MPPLNSWQTIPVPPPTLPSVTGPPDGGGEGVVDVLGPDVETVDVVEGAVVGLAGHRQRPDGVAHVVRIAPPTR